MAFLHLGKIWHRVNLKFVVLMEDVYTIVLLRDAGTEEKWGNKHRCGIWECPICRSEFKASYHDVKTGRKKTCGCVVLTENNQLSEVCGIKVLQHLPSVKGRAMAMFECPLCVKPFSYTVDQVKRGIKSHCGCYKKPLKEKPIKSAPVSVWDTEPYIHLGYKGYTINHPLYYTYNGMRQRCMRTTHPKYSNYGGRGIKVCDRWMKSFQDFVLDMGDRPSSEHSIDRIDNDGDYEPGNCKWSTAKEQQNNKRARSIELNTH